MRNLLTDVYGHDEHEIGGVELLLPRTSAEALAEG